ncbi:DoxX family protein [Mechercharimyces sp. CAU 1602]|uniref:DoxX family protein n=1 Tax=Mechercharimyces sp. CAU 1602 TaxID=2973933 RepID=UPI0021617214|nr:DoxX family protein [Mechercharimyces sp. CAU 1602]MCS1352845.1 DoxX family protein [Mechercharimyces sp. CAU 1602]
MKWVVRILQGLLGASFTFIGANMLLAAESMATQFEALNLPIWFVYVTGVLELFCGLGLLAGFWKNKLITWSAGFIAVIMAGAVFFHFAAGQGIAEAAPASIIFLLALILTYGQYRLNSKS